MSEKKGNFDDKKIKKCDFYKNKRVIRYITLMLIKY